jgi:hypothetical protein
MSAVAILGSLGGIIAFIGAVVLVIRAIFKQIGAVEDNTRTLKEIKAILMDDPSTGRMGLVTRFRLLEDRVNRASH